MEITQVALRVMCMGKDFDDLPPAFRQVRPTYLVPTTYNPVPTYLVPTTWYLEPSTYLPSIVQLCSLQSSNIKIFVLKIRQL